MLDFSKIAVVILAAGKSSRFGSQKQLADWHGITLIENAIKIVIEANFRNIFVSLDCSHTNISQKLESKPVNIIFSENAQKGMGSTISDSITKIKSHGEEFEACLILLCDQPLIPSKHLVKLAISNQHNECTFTKYQNTEGTPAIFSNYFFKELEELKGEIGAKSIINKLSARFVKYESEFLDIDFQSDIEKLKAKN
jgi:molybdenum cofactor cytidylyltransferase